MASWPGGRQWACPVVSRIRATRPRASYRRHRLGGTRRDAARLGIGCELNRGLAIKKGEKEKAAKGGAGRVRTDASCGSGAVDTPRIQRRLAG